MSSSVFLTHELLYRGDYRIIKYNSENEFSYSNHYHDFYEVQLYLHDIGTLMIGGRDYKIKSGDIALIDIFEPHMLLRDPGADQDRYCFSLDPDFLLSSCSDHSNLLCIFSKSNRNYPVVHLDDADFAKYLSLLDRYNNIDISHGRDIMERALLYELLANLYDRFYDETHARPQDTGSIETIIRLVHHINEHIAEDLSLERLAAEVNFSRFYICRLFKKFTGYTLNKYIISKRLEKSAQLLRGSAPIGEISRQFGFNNYSCFYKAFKKEYGVGPDKYRSSL